MSSITTPQIPAYRPEIVKLPHLLDHLESIGLNLNSIGLGSVLRNKRKRLLDDLYDGGKTEIKAFNSYSLPERSYSTTSEKNHVLLSNDSTSQNSTVTYLTPRMSPSNQLFNTKRRRTSSIQRESNYMNSLKAEMTTANFHQWFASKRSHFVMERGVRIMNPSIIDIKWTDVKPYAKPKITEQAFFLEYKNNISEDTKHFYKSKDTIAFMAAFRCNGTSSHCTPVCSAVTSNENTSHEADLTKRRYCVMTYEIKVYYNDLSKVHVYSKNEHE